MVWIVLSSMVAGALISEMYHARMWSLYRRGKCEGMSVGRREEEARKQQRR